MFTIGAGYPTFFYMFLIFVDEKYEKILLLKSKKSEIFFKRKFWSVFKRMCLTACCDRNENIFSRAFKGLKEELLGHNLAPTAHIDLLICIYNSVRRMRALYGDIKQG